MSPEHAIELLALAGVIDRGARRIAQALALDENPLPASVPSVELIVDACRDLVALAAKTPEAPGAAHPCDERIAPLSPTPGARETADEVARLRRELGRFSARVIAEAEVPCVKDPSWKRYPMKCLPNDPCSFCRARTTIKQVEDDHG